MSKVTLSGHIIVPDEDLASVRAAHHAHISATRSEPECLVFEVKERPEEKGIFDVYEEFVSKEAFENHQKRVRESDWGKISKNVSRHYSVHGVPYVQTPDQSTQEPSQPTPSP